MKSVLESRKKSVFEAPSSFIALESAPSKVEARDSPSVQAQQLLRNDDEMSNEQLQNGLFVVALMLTRRCNMSCAHCSVESGPRITSQPTDDELIQAVRDAAKSGAFAVQLTGGEPMLRENLVMRLLAELKAANVMATVSSNGFWGKDLEVARRKVRDLSEAGVQRLTISYDRYHAAFQGAEPAVNIARAIEESDLTMQLSINFTRVENEDLGDLVAPFDDFSKLQMRFYDVQAVGRARDFERESLRKECEGFCTAACVPTITDDGRVTACNGPAYFSDANSPLVIGSLRDNTFEQLLQQHRSDPVLDTIRTFGPMRLRRELEQNPEIQQLADGFQFRDGYSGMCDLCLHMNAQPAMMNALRAHLSQPRLVAERIAAQRVMKTARSCEGELARDNINGSGAARLFLRAITQPQSVRESEWHEDAERVLGRPDFDWHAQIRHLAQCGVAGALHGAWSSPSVTRWAPQFFLDEMNKIAMSDALRTLLQREALRIIAQTAREMKVPIVLLKGAALLALSHEPEHRVLDVQSQTAVRSSGDIDIWILPEHAPRVREKLLALGWSDAAKRDWDENTQGLDQLESLYYKGVLVEIHQTLMPGFFDLPEAEMWRSQRPLSHPNFAGLSVMSPEAMWLHAVQHTTKHLWTHGLKTALDCWWIVENAPDFNWSQIARWAKNCKMKRGLLATAKVLDEELSLGFSSELLKLAPTGNRQKKLEELARRHLFGVRPAANEEEEAGRRRVLYTLMSDSKKLQLRCVASVITGKTRLRSLSHSGCNSSLAKSANLTQRARNLNTMWRIWR